MKSPLNATFIQKLRGALQLKVLPAVLDTSELLREYSKPIGDNLSSLNFPKNFVWFKEVGAKAVDPYELLKLHTIDLFKETNSNISHENYPSQRGALLRWHMHDYNTKS